MRLLGLADCSSRDFSAHITHVSQVMIRYDLLAAIRISSHYFIMSFASSEAASFSHSSGEV